MRFINFFPEDKVEHWQPSNFSPHLAIDAHTRYFTERRQAPQETNIPFGPMVDPNGLLAGLQGSDFIHGQDNYVKYLELHNHEGNTRSVIPIKAKCTATDL